MCRLSNDTSIVGSAVTNNISDGLRATFQACAGVSMMVYTSPKLAAVSLAIVPPFILIARMYGRYVRNITKQVQDELAASTQVIIISILVSCKIFYFVLAKVWVPVFLSSDSYFQAAEERLSNIRTVRAFAQEPREVSVYERRVDAVMQLGFKEALARSAFWATVSTYSFLSMPR